MRLREQVKQARDDQIAAWATEMSGTDYDLDPGLEAAGIEHLVHAGKPRGKRSKLRWISIDRPVIKSV